MHRNPFAPTAAYYLIKYTVVIPNSEKIHDAGKRARWIYDIGFPERLLRHVMTDLACTYPILNRLILNGFQTMSILAILSVWNIRQMQTCRAHVTNFIYISIRLREGCVICFDLTNIYRTHTLHVDVNRSIVFDIS